MRPVRFTVQQIPIEEISIGPNRRPVDWAAVDVLVESIRKIGLRTPVTVRRSDHIDEDGVIAGQDWTLIAGRHRLEAARKLGWTEIDVIFVDCDEIDAEIYEISENLHRNDLTKEQRDQQIRRFAELLRVKEEAGVDKLSTPGLDSRGQRKSPQQQPSIETKIAKQTGLHRRTIKRALNPEPKIVKLAEEPLSEEERLERWIARGMSWWNAGSHEWQEEFKARIDKPVMDARFAPNPHTGTANGEGIPAFLRKDQA